ncbi:MAG: hypothetical protein GY765_14600 [bacterium]|nr:hypothetical protein [bacterium]
MKSDINQNSYGTIFESLCLYQEYTEKYSMAILNYNHRNTTDAPGMDKLEAIKQEFQKNPSVENYTLLFDSLKAVDKSLDGEAAMEYVYDNGILLVGKSTWQAFSLLPGEYPFTNLRFIQMQKSDIERYQNTPKIDFKTPGNLKVGACTLTSSTVTQFGGAANLHGKEYGLVAESISNPDQLAKDILSSLEWAKSNGVDVLLFPELSIDDEGTQVIEKWIGDNKDQLDTLPGIIVAGTFYRNVDGNLRNRAPIYLIDGKSSGGSPFYKTYYDKHVPFSMTVPHSTAKVSNPALKKLYDEAKAAGATIIVEDFVSSDSITPVNTSAGVIGFAVCRDVLDLAGIGNPLRRYLDFVDFAMIVSFNDGITNLFEAQGEDLARWHNCGVCYVNAMQAVPNCQTNSEVKMSFAIYPYDKAGSAISGEIYYGNPLQEKFGEIQLKKVPQDGNILYVLSPTP